jgi:outer membrane protein assembly factor BamB
MAGNGRVFISHAHEDNARSQPLLAALDAWGVDYWFDAQQLGAGQHISERVQQALAERDIFLLICTPATNQSMWTSLEQQAFRGLAERDRQSGRGSQRSVILLILDPGYVRQPVQPGDRVIDATRSHPAVWFKELRQALGIKPPARGLSRRAVLTAGATAAVAVIASATAGVALLNRGGTRPPPVTPSIHMPTSTPLPEAGRLKWFFQTVEGAAAAAVANGVVYLTGGDGCYALSAASGDVIWYKSRLSGATNSVPQIVGGVMYFCGNEDSLLAVHPQDGSEVWSVPFAFSTQSTPLVTDTAVYAHGSDGYMYALNVSDGKPRWKTQIGTTEALSLSSPAASASLIYCGSSDGSLHALDKNTGAVVWKYATSGKIVSSPAFADGVVYFGSADNNVYALDAATGAKRWSHQTDYEVNSSPTVANGVVYIGSSDAYLYAFKTTGELVWRAGAGAVDASGELTGLGDLIECRPALVGGAVYVTAGKYIYAFDAAIGKQLWRFTTPAFPIDTSPIAGNGLIYVAWSDFSNNALYAISVS